MCRLQAMVSSRWLLVFVICYITLYDCGIMCSMLDLSWWAFSSVWRSVRFIVDVSTRSRRCITYVLVQCCTTTLYHFVLITVLTHIYIYCFVLQSVEGGRCIVFMIYVVHNFCFWQSNSWFLSFSCAGFTTSCVLSVMPAQSIYNDCSSVCNALSYCLT